MRCRLYLATNTPSVMFIPHIILIITPCISCIDRRLLRPSGRINDAERRGREGEGKRGRGREGGGRGRPPVSSPQSYSLHESTVSTVSTATLQTPLYTHLTHIINLLAHLGYRPSILRRKPLSSYAAAGRREGGERGEREGESVSHYTASHIHTAPHTGRLSPPRVLTIHNFPPCRCMIRPHRL